MIKIIQPGGSKYVVRGGSKKVVIDKRAKQKPEGEPGKSKS